MQYKGGDDDQNLPPVVNPDPNVPGVEGGDSQAEGDPGRPVVDDSQLG